VFSDAAAAANARAEPEMVSGEIEVLGTMTLAKGEPPARELR
jgi:hypothetical protein